MVPIEENGKTITLSSGGVLEVVPSHFLHSTGCYSLYDPQAKVLFSGDIGAAAFGSEKYVFVDDFDEHKKFIDMFHRRYMGSNKVLRSGLSL
jgi:flavorubredoxin